MIGIYFSGTGNSRYVLELFLRKYNEKENNYKAYSIDDENVVNYIKKNDTIAFCYPVQYSNIPKILKDFVYENQNLWKGKKIFVIATMGLFSGDGAGVLARLFHKYEAKIIGGLHLKMPDSIADEKALNRSIEKNRELIKSAENKIEKAAKDMKNGIPPQEGLGFLSHLIGLFGQRLYFTNKTKKYSNKLKIDEEKCVGCGKCVSICPMKNLSMEKNIVKSAGKCTMCYHCINICPRQAITLLGKRVIAQGTIEKYL